MNLHKANTNQRKNEVTLLISENIDVKTRNIIRGGNAQCILPYEVNLANSSNIRCSYSP